MPAVFPGPEHIRLSASYTLLACAALLVAGCAAPGNETDSDGDAIRSTCDFEYPDGSPVECDDNSTVETRLAASDLQWGCIRHEPDFFILHLDRLNARAIIELTLNEPGGNWAVFTIQQRASLDAPANTMQVAFLTAGDVERVPIDALLTGELRIIAEAYSLNLSAERNIAWRPLWSVYLPNGTDGEDVPENWLIVEASLGGNSTEYVDPMAEIDARPPREGTYHVPQDTNVTFTGMDMLLGVDALAAYVEVVWDAAAETHSSCRPA